MSLFRYIGSEVTRSYMLEHDQERYTSKREKMYTFMRIPRYLKDNNDLLAWLLTINLQRVGEIHVLWLLSLS